MSHTAQPNHQLRPPTAILAALRPMNALTNEVLNGLVSNTSLKVPASTNGELV